MKTRTKKILSLLMAATLFGSLLTGCESNASSAAPSTGASTGKAIELKWLSFYGPETNDTYPQTYLEQKFNVKISNMLIDRTLWNDQFNIKLASGEIPDIFWMWGPGDVATYQKQGVLAEVPKSKIEEKMPVYAKSVSQLEPRLWFNSQVNGKNYGVPLYWENGAVPQSPVYNKDWLTKLGLSVPKTLDEYVEVLTKFANADPDGNGKKDTYGISFRGKDSLVQTMMNIYWAYGVPTMNWAPSDEDDTALTMSFNTKAWKEATQLIQQLYKDGIIDPESITDDNAQLTQKFANKRTGVLENGNFYHWLPGTGGYRIAADNAGVNLEFGHLTPKDGYYRDSAVMSGGVNNSIVGMGIQVEKDQEKMNKILEIFEALHSDEETYLATAFGKEGDTYTMKNGIPVRDSKVGDMIQQGTKYGIGTFYGLFGQAKSIPMAKFDYSAEELKLKENFLTDTNIQMPYFLGGLPSSAKYPDITAFQNENFIKFITGELNLEKDLDDFRAKWLSSGGEVLAKEATELYREQNNK